MSRKADRGIVIDRNRLYSTQAVLELGIGRVALRNAREAGVTPKRRPGLKSSFYSGDELANWIAFGHARTFQQEVGDE